MLIIREVMHCKPGKVRPLVEKFLAMSVLMKKNGMSAMRVMTDVSTDRYWTLVAEMEVENLAAFESMMAPGKMSDADAKAFEEIMKGYHDLVESGRREIYKLEGSAARVADRREDRARLSRTNRGVSPGPVEGRRAPDDRSGALRRHLSAASAQAAWRRRSTSPTNDVRSLRHRFASSSE